MNSTKITGLSASQAAIKLASQGPNRITQGKKRNMIVSFLCQFKDFMILILMASAVVSIYLGDSLQGYIILGIVIINALFGFIQEFRTEKALVALSALATKTAKVLRSGKQLTINAEAIVDGDVVLLQAGDRVPADGILITSTGISVDESLLSGESLALDKQQGDTLYMGTTLFTGHGMLKITKTGMATEMGKIAHMLQSIKQEDTPLQKKLDNMGKIIAIICLAVCVLVTILGIISGKDAYTMFVSGVSLAVAAIPEGLPAIVTASLAMGVSRMTKRNALVRKLPAVETLGCATVICTDKTGTLTQNSMTVTHTWFVPNMEEIALNIMRTCATVDPDNNSGSPTETALYQYALRRGGNTFEKIQEIPFDSTRKYMAVTCSVNGKLTVYVKGAPEILMSFCKPSTLLSSAKNELRQMTSQGLRVLALAQGSCPSAQIWDISDFNLQLVGLIGLMDPPRPESQEAVRKCQQAGITTIMITGDSKETAVSIGKSLGILEDESQALTGQDLDQMEPSDLAKALKSTRVFARATPSHKLAIVKSLKTSGEIVAMTGDGVNDSPAIKEAHIGVSMGKGGSDVTREASAISLMDDNFATLVHAVEEGRLIYRNILRFVRYMLACNLGEVLTMVIAILLNLPLPLLASQLLLVNVITDGLPAMALGFSPTYKELMQVPPRNPNSQIINKKTAARILLRGLLIGISTVGIFVLTDYLGGNMLVCRGSALSMLVVSQLIYVFGCNRDGRRFSFSTLFDNKTLVWAVAISGVILLSCLYCPILAGALLIAPPTVTLWMIILGASLTGLLF